MFKIINTIKWGRQKYGTRLYHEYWIVTRNTHSFSTATNVSNYLVLTIDIHSPMQEICMYNIQFNLMCASSSLVYRKYTNNSILATNIHSLLEKMYTYNLQFNLTCAFSKIYYSLVDKKYENHQESSTFNFTWLI